MQNMNPINAVALATALRSKKGQFGAVMVAITEERSLLKRAWKNTALAGAAVYKLSRMANLGVGWNYARVVQRRAEAVEPSAPWAFPAPFIPDPPSGMRCVEEFDDIFVLSLLILITNLAVTGIIKLLTRPRRKAAAV